MYYLFNLRCSCVTRVHCICSFFAQQTPVFCARLSGKARGHVTAALRGEDVFKLLISKLTETMYASGVFILAYHYTSKRSLRVMVVAKLVNLAALLFVLQC